MAAVRPRFESVQRIKTSSGEAFAYSTPSSTYRAPSEMPVSQVRASHILLMYKGSSRSSASRSKDEALTGIEDLARQIADGADFALLARGHSDCPSSAQGGDLGFFGRGQMVPEFEAAAFSMQPGEVSDVIETAFGYHLVRRTA